MSDNLFVVIMNCHCITSMPYTRVFSCIRIFCSVCENINHENAFPWSGHILGNQQIYAVMWILWKIHLCRKNSTSWHVNDLMEYLHAVGQSVFNTVWEISSFGVLQKFYHYIENDWHTKEHFFFRIPGPTSSDDKNELQPKSSKNLVCHVIIKTEKNFIKVRNALINTVLTIITLHQREWGMCVLLVTEFCSQ